MHPALEYAIDEAMIVTPALEMPNIWRATALPVGIALMLLLGVLRIAPLGAACRSGAGARGRRRRSAPGFGF